jgi:hypothetical protein
MVESIIIPIKDGEFEKIYQDAVEKVGNKLSLDDINEILNRCDTIIDNEPTISKYALTVKSFTIMLRQKYNKVGSPNRFHQHLKSIDPEQYGRAQTFMAEINKLKNFMEDVEGYYRQEIG